MSEDYNNLSWKEILKRLDWKLFLLAFFITVIIVYVMLTERVIQ